MKVRVLVCAAALVTGLRGAAAANDPLRAVEIAELHRTLESALVAALDAPPAIAGRAALAIGRTKRAEGAGPLSAHLHVADPAERALVVYALGLLGDAGSLAAVRALSVNDTDAAVRYAAVDALGRIALAVPESATRELALGLLGVARGDADAVVRAHAAVQLDVFGSAPFAADIVRGLEDGLARERVAEVRRHAAWAIFRGYAKLADADFLRRALQDGDELVRVSALRAWGRRTDPDAANFVRPLLADPSWRVQLEAGEALKRLAKLAPTEHLTEFPSNLHLPPVPRGHIERPPGMGVGSADAASAPKAPSAPSVPSAPNAPSAPGAPGAPAKPSAPDPATLPLGTQALLPASAAAMNGPAGGPHPRISIATTKGEVVVRLYPEWAPSTVANFSALAERGFFDGNRWFRIVPDFVVQSGDRNENGEGDAGFSIPAEENPVEQRSGVIAMGLDYAAARPKRDSAATQFYITLSPQYHLDRDFTVFGEVESGFAVLAHLLESDRITVVRRIADR